MGDGVIQPLNIQGLKLTCPCCIEDYIGEILMFIEDYKDDNAMLNRIQYFLQEQYQDNVNLGNKVRANVFLAFRNFTATTLAYCNGNFTC